MRRDAVYGQLSELAFEFFFRFSRFESALKENKFLKSLKPGAKAEPDWKAFAAAYKDVYALTMHAAELLALAPETQVVAEDGNLDWRQTFLDDSDSKLGQVTLLLRTVRNNLFHGGKHGSVNWDSPERTTKLLNASLMVLNELAATSGIEADYERYY